MKKYRFSIITTMIALAVIMWAYLTNFDLCFIHRLFHIPCAGCGFTRAFVNLLKLNISDCIKYNILCIPIVFMGIIYITLCLFNKKELVDNFLYRHKVIIITIATILMVLSFVRNLNNPLLY